MYWDISSIVEIFHPVSELWTGLSHVSWKLEPLHEDEGNELSNFVQQNLPLQSLALISLYIHLQNDLLVLNGLKNVSHHH